MQAMSERDKGVLWLYDEKSTTSKSQLEAQRQNFILPLEAQPVLPLPAMTSYDFIQYFI